MHNKQIEVLSLLQEVLTKPGTPISNLKRNSNINDIRCIMYVIAQTNNSYIKKLVIKMLHFTSF